MQKEKLNLNQLIKASSLEDFSVKEILKELVRATSLKEVTISLHDIVNEEGNTTSIIDLPAVSEVYKGGFFKKRNSLSWRVPIICKTIVDVFDLRPEKDSIIDCGCAIGDYVRGFIKNGYRSWGIEGSIAAKEFAASSCISYLDLRQPLPDHERICRYSLCISLEVAEHIDPDYVDIYLNNLCFLSDTILITAAPPGQKGHGHVNCQEKYYWETKMISRGYTRLPHFERDFQRRLMEYPRKEVQVYSKNCMIFRKIKVK